MHLNLLINKLHKNSLYFVQFASRYVVNALFAPNIILIDNKVREERQIV